MTPQVVAFDLGKVLVDFDYRIAARKMAVHSRMSAGEIQSFVDQSPLLLRFETGLMSNEEFFEEFCAATGYRGSLAGFGELFGDIFTLIPPMVEWHARLRARGMPAYIFSNTNDFAVTHIRREFPFFSDFDGYILSYQVRAMKPDARIYEALEKMSGRKGAEILYLDDRLENVEAGQARGWQVIHHHNPEKTLLEVRRLGLH